MESFVENPQDLLLDNVEIDDSPPADIPVQLDRDQEDLCSVFHQ